MIIDKHSFKVICQKCGETGEVNFTKKGSENGFYLMFSAQEDVDELEECEFYLCGRCYDEYYACLEVVP